MSRRAAGDRPRILTVVGPTAAGKTELAVELASGLDGEIVSVDSRQVYRRLDIGTAKPPLEARARVPHHMIDVIEPDERYDVARYREDARAATEAALARGRRVLFCGGSGLYLRVLTEGLCPAPPADAEVRAEIQGEIETRGREALHADLARIDPAAAARIAPRDAVRITRALEVARLTGRSLSAWQREHGFGDRPYDTATWVLSPPVGELERRIAARARAMWAAGLVDETRAVLDAGFAPGLAPLQAIGYREAQQVLRGEIDDESALAGMCRDTRRLAKRQRTWFRGLEGAVRLDGSESPDALLERARRFLDGGG